MVLRARLAKLSILAAAMPISGGGADVLGADFGPYRVQTADASARLDGAGGVGACGGAGTSGTAAAAGGAAGNAGSGGHVDAGEGAAACTETTYRIAAQRSPTAATRVAGA
jgi:hypothetical protein